MKRISYLFVFISLLFILSCKKEKEQPVPTETIESLLCTGTWTEDYTVNIYYKYKQITDEKSSDEPDSISRKKSTNGLKATFYKDTKTTLILNGYIKPFESTWGYDQEMGVLYTKATIDLGAYIFPVFPPGTIEVNKNELIVKGLIMFYVNYAKGTKTKILSETHFKH
ncbi:hypothetical protein H7F33_14350 [Pedobacter sp. PAMC26386]|nr:hypothetical protein H7F33_14350 [Pedobacter sp. PAMC26386]